MEALVPWAKLLAVIEPFHPQGQRGHPPIGLERMLQVYFLQQWYGLADEPKRPPQFSDAAACFSTNKNLKFGKSALISASLIHHDQNFSAVFSRDFCGNIFRGALPGVRQFSPSFSCATA
jgi:hypothetical protein